MKRLTLKEMAGQLNDWYKGHGYAIQYTVLGRTVLYVDYSVPAKWTEYGRQPVYIDKRSASKLRREYDWMLRGLLK